MSKKKVTTNSPDVCFKIHQRSGEILLAACDIDLLDKSWKEGKRILSAPAPFYNEMVCDDISTLSNMMKTCTQANLVGKRVIDHFIEEGFIDEKSVISIEGVPHAIYVRLL